MRSILYFILVCGFSIFSFTAPGQISWVNPLPQGNPLRSIFFTDGETGFMAGDAGALLRSTNNGLAWTLVDSLTANNISSIHFYGQGTGYAVGDSGIILKSTDAGLSWTQLNSATNKIINDICTIDSLTAITVGDAGVITRTVDGGNTWQKVYSNTYLHLCSVSFPDDSIGYAAGGDKGYNGIIMKTRNQGETWDTVKVSPDGHLYSVFFLDTLRGYAAGNYSQILKTTNGGQSWTLLSNPNQNGNHHIRDMVFTDLNTGFTADIHGNIMRTFNGGMTWDSLSSHVTTALYAIGVNNEGTVFAAGHGGKITRSTDEGLNWLTISSGPLTNLVSIDFPEPNKGFIIGGGGFYKTINGGQEWDYNQAEQLMYAVDAHFLSASVGYVLDVDGAIFKTIDGGASWSEQNTGEKSQAYRSIFMVSATQGYAVGGGQTSINAWSLALRTTDGENWGNMPIAVDEQLFDVFFINASKGFIVGAKGTLLQTSNGGNNWQNIGLDTTYTWVDVSFISDTVGFATGNKQGSSVVYRTVNGGESWQGFFSPEHLKSNEKITATRFADPVNGFAIGSGGLIFKTINGGESWSRVMKITNNLLNDIYPRGGFDGFIVGTGGTILRMDPVVGIPDLTNQETSSFSIFPNPASGSVRLRYLIRDSGYLVSDLYMVSGMKIRELVRKEVNAGEFEIEIDVSDLPAGVYLIRLQAGDARAVQKLVVGD